MPSIFEHLDYRIFLGIWYKAEKSARRGVSYRSIAAKVGYASPGFFTQILQGKTNISLETAEGFASLIGLKGRASEYFLTLVLWNQAKDPIVRDKTRAKLERFHEFRIHELKGDQERFLESWHHAAIREILGIQPFQGDQESLAKCLEPPISGVSARESVDLLLSLGLAARTSRGVIRRDAALSSGRSLPEQTTDRFFRELHGLGLQAMDRFPKDERNMSWVTFSVSDRTREEIVEELRTFRRRVLEIAQRDENPTRVHQLTILMHPLSRRLTSDRPA
jgi:uncharacterized protein (TIGR02147 family)